MINRVLAHAAVALGLLGVFAGALVAMAIALGVPPGQSWIGALVIGGVATSGMVARVWRHAPAVRQPPPAPRHLPAPGDPLPQSSRAEQFDSEAAPRLAARLEGRAGARPSRAGGPG